MLSSLRSVYRFSVRVRYAPSPTGPMHLGAVRTALFNYMFARHNQGKFIVRMEDTDLARNVTESMNDILDTLDWLGIGPDESPRKGGPYGPYVQSERLKLYKQIQNQLLYKGQAYPCFCNGETHEKGKPNKKGNDAEIGYDGTCRKLTLEQVKNKISNGEKYAVRIKSNFADLIPSEFTDQVFGKVSASKFDDYIIMKKNGYPTYHFANVIDDWKMGITHVIRGVEWLTNTPKHIYLYRLLKATPPVFMHLPLVFAADGKKLSKRDPTAPVGNLRQKGYLPQAIINYTGLLGFNPVKKQAEPEKKNQESLQQKPKKAKGEVKNEFFSLTELCELFEIKEVKNSPVKSDNKKLDFFNRYYLRKKWKEGNEDTLAKIIAAMRDHHRLTPSAKQYSVQFLKQVVECIIERISNLDDLKDYGYFFNQPNLATESTLADITKMFGQETKLDTASGFPTLINFKPELMDKNRKILHNLRLIFVHIIAPGDYSETKIAECISKFLFDNKQYSNEDVYHILRLAVTGHKSGVNIVKTCYILGQTRIQKDLERLAQLCK